MKISFCTFFWAAASLWATWTAHVTATALGTALTTAHAQEDEEQKSSDDDEQHSQPVWI